MALPAEERRYTFADILEWPEEERAELIDGQIYMQAAPSSEHQAVSMELSRQLANYLEGKNCRVFPAPFAVRLFEEDGDRPWDVDVMVEPDISVICDRSKIDKNGCKGAPDMVIEILSPATRRRDRLEKLNLYQRAGVREYWIVNPEDRTVQVLLLDEATHLLLPREDYGEKDTAAVNILEDCTVDLERVFAENW